MGFLGSQRFLLFNISLLLSCVRLFKFYFPREVIISKNFLNQNTLLCFNVLIAALISMKLDMDVFWFLTKAIDNRYRDNRHTRARGKMSVTDSRLNRCIDFDELDMEMLWILRKNKGYFLPR